MQFGEQLGAMVNAVERIVKHDNIGTVQRRGGVVEIYDQADAFGDARRDEWLPLQDRDCVGPLELEHANELIGFTRIVLRWVVLRECGKREAEDDAKPYQQCVSCHSRNK